MSRELRQRLFAELDALTLIDPHTHIDPVRPAAATLADILGYHYYTELAHSAGMPRERIEEPGLDPKEKSRRLAPWLSSIDNTIPMSWLGQMLWDLFDLPVETINADNWEMVYDHTAAALARPDWVDSVLRRSKLEAVFLTNDFDDPLTGFDTARYVPCLRTDDLVFHLARPDVRRRLSQATAIDAHDPASLRQAIGRLFERFAGRGARACAISLPPDFAPRRVSAAEARRALADALASGESADAANRRALAAFVFWTLAEYCAEFRLPFDLMIGVTRNVYEAGVHQGRDLYDSRVSLIQYRELFNAFPAVKFPVSVLASVTNQELVSYSWIFPNVICHGHWWYSNTPVPIERDAAARLEGAPRAKQIGYYSDMYKLEFALPKFAMYKRILAKILAERFVIERSWSEERAVALGKQTLVDNVRTIFYRE